MEEKKEPIFRKKALDEIRAPEQLDTYLKVTNPGVWAILAAVVLLFVGLFAWASIGTLETTADAVAAVQDGLATIRMTGAADAKIHSDMTVRIENREYDIAIVEKDEYARSVAMAPVDLANGNYDAKIILERVSPISFLIQ